MNIILLTGSQLSFLIDGCADGNVCYDTVNASVEISEVGFAIDTFSPS